MSGLTQRFVTTLKSAHQRVRKAIHLPRAVHIRELSERHRPLILEHLMKLDAHDRYLRFGYNANDEQVARYANHLDFQRDDIFGVFDSRLDLMAVAHLAYLNVGKANSSAEFGVSVLKSARGLGLGSRMFRRAMLHTRNMGISMMFIHALSENGPMLRIARNAGARVERDGTESEAYLQLPAAETDTYVSELMANQIAVVDYQIKKQAKQFWDILADVHEMRKNARNHHTPE